MRPLTVAIYSDGRPGHEKQSLAVLSALKVLTPLSVISIKLDETAGIKRLFQGLISFIAPSHSSDIPLPEQIDLIIGTGSTTHFPMVGLKRRTGAKLVTCMTPDPLLRSRFDLCLVPRHDRPPVRPENFSTFGPPCLALNSDGHDPGKGLILAGGVDPKSHYWDTAYFMSQLEGLILSSPHKRWTISSSPRTPGDAIEKLEDLAKDKDRVVFFRADDTPRGWIESAYESHAQVWVTADSVSMIYEALTAGCRVGVLPVKWKNPNNKFQNGIDDLKNQGMVADFEQWTKGVALPMATPPLNEAVRCAQEILRRWWPERLA